MAAAVKHLSPLGLALQDHPAAAERAGDSGLLFLRVGLLALVISVKSSDVNDRYQVRVCYRSGSLNRLFCADYVSSHRRRC
jgi:hypothetical protein